MCENMFQILGNTVPRKQRSQEMIVLNWNSPSCMNAPVGVSSDLSKHLYAYKVAHPSSLCCPEVGEPSKLLLPVKSPW